jgi:hypothetical protein
VVAIRQTIDGWPIVAFSDGHVLLANPDPEPHLALRGVVASVYPPRVFHVLDSMGWATAREIGSVLGEDMPPPAAPVSDDIGPARRKRRDG